MENCFLTSSKPRQGTGGGAHGGREHGLGGRWTSVTCWGKLFPGVGDPGVVRGPLRASVSSSVKQGY